MQAVMGVKDIVNAIEQIAPSSLAEGWDNCGLQVGDPDGSANRILVALTPLPEVFDEAEDVGADFLLFHHPLIFKELKSVDTGSYPGNLVARTISSDMIVYAAHTSYDAAPDGVSAALAEALGLAGRLDVFVPRGALRKLVVFVPEDHVEAVADALSGSGAGIIGGYTHCTFRTPGVGTFLPGEGTDPYSGKPGRLERAEEIRLETIVPAHDASQAVAAAKEAHPYEEVAFDVYPVEGFPTGCGYGRVGRLPYPLASRELAEYVSEALGFPARVVADPEPSRRIERVAVLGGSGGSFIAKAAASGAQAYVTGDLDYHDSLLAGSLGLAAIDAGHEATELPSLQPFARRLAELVSVPVEVSSIRS